MTTLKNITELLIAYGYELEFDDESQHKKRFTSETGFVDLWTGKKGLTVGIYNPRTKLCAFKRNPTIDLIEKEIMRVNK